MSNCKKKRHVIRSIKEFERTYFPKSSGEKIPEIHENARNIGVDWAKDTISKIKGLIRDD